MIQTDDMQRASLIQSEIGWAKVFLAFLREAEAEADQIRIRGLGVEWKPGPTAHHGSDLVQYFERLDSHRNAPPLANRMANAVGSRTSRK
jgi:hypothetical protein